MFRKPVSVLIVLLLCCALAAAVFSQPQNPPVENGRISSGGEELALAADGVQTTYADPDYLDWLYGAPEEILSGPTPELLDYFLQSSFLGQQVYSCAAAPGQEADIDLSLHAALRELISREDCGETLAAYAERLDGGSESALEERGFELLISHPLVQPLLAN